MEKFTTLTSLATPLPVDDVDTDLIIPAQFLTSVSREGYGQNLFRRLRDADTDFVLNRPAYQQSKILIGGDNFGCGSSREHAVWAIMGFGFRVVLAKSFADIFFSNSAKNGLLLVTLTEAEIDQLLASAEQQALELTVDLESQTITSAAGQQYSFDYDPFRKHCLLNGLDDIDYILAKQDEIERFRSSQPRFFSTTESA